MIVTERKGIVEKEKFNNFGDAMLDGRLTEPSSCKEYRLREAILLSKQLGRPLTEDEMKEFELA